MARRRTTYRRRRTTRRRFVRKTKYRRGYKTKRGQKTYYFKRFTNRLGPITVDNINPLLVGFNFSLDDLPNYQEFTNLYDTYRLNAVKITFLPQMTESISLSAFNNPNASVRFFSVIDYNDSAPPATIDELREYQSCKFTPVLKRHSRYIYRPKIQDRGSTYAPGRPWIDTSAPDQDHFGLKIGIEPIQSTNITSMGYTVEAKYYLSFRAVR